MEGQSIEDDKMMIDNIIKDKGSSKPSRSNNISTQ